MLRPSWCIMLRWTWCQHVPLLVKLRKTHFKIILVRRVTFCLKPGPVTYFWLRDKILCHVLWIAEHLLGRPRMLCTCSRPLLHGYTRCQGAKANRHSPCSKGLASGGRSCRTQSLSTEISAETVCVQDHPGCTAWELCDLKQVILLC